MQASKLLNAFEQAQQKGATLVVEHYYDGSHFPSVIHASGVVTGYDNDGETVIVYSDDPTQTVEYHPEVEVDAYLIGKIPLD